MNLFRFAEPNYLYLLIVIPIIVILYIINRVRRAKELRRLGDQDLVDQMIPLKSKHLSTIRMITLTLSLTTLIFALAQPQYGASLQKVKKRGIELIIALDVSRSMMAEDIVPNRLERSKMAIAKLIEKLDGDRIGLVVFAGNAYTQLPLTTDYPSAKMFLNTISTDIIPIQGTSISAALSLSARSFSENFNGSKAVVIISDGEDHEEGAIEMARQLRDNGILIYTLGMGLESGAPIPYIDESGSQKYFADKEGNTVISKLNEQMLKEVAVAGSGKYIRANNSNVGLNRIFDEIVNLQDEEIEERRYDSYNDQFPYLLWIALALLIIDLVILNRKFRWAANIKLFKALVALVATTTLLTISTNSYAQKERSMIRKGNDLYEKAASDTVKLDSINFSKAETQYRRALEIAPENFKWKFNLGDAVLAQGHFDDAEEIFQELADASITKEEKGSSYYNLGNSQLAQQKFDDAIESYKRSLRAEPTNFSAKYNLTVAKKLKEEQEKQEQEQDQNKDNKDDQNKDNKDDQNKDNKDDQNKDNKDDQNKDNKDDQNKDNKDDQNKDNKDDQNKDNKDDQNKDNKNDQNKEDQQQGKQPKINKQKAQSMLNALDNDEKKTQEKVKKAQAIKAGKRKVEKEW